MRDVWRYSEPRIRKQNSSPSYKEIRREGYNELLYSLFYHFRLRSGNGQTRSSLFVGDWKRLANAVSMYRGTLNHGGFLDERFNDLVERGLIRPNGSNPYRPDEPGYDVAE